MILMRYLYEQKGLRGEVVKTVSLTNMVNMYCEEKGITLHETPVGFKYTAELMAQGKVLIGGEESGGLGTKLHIPERDGVFNGLLLLEVMAKRNMTLKELCEELDNDFGIHRYARRDVKVTQEVKDRVLTSAKNAPKTLAGYEVKSINTKDGFKFIVDGGWLLIRASGTEPLLRFYSEAKSIDMVNELLDAGLNL
jgi:phosphomannomutase